MHRPSYYGLDSDAGRTYNCREIVLGGEKPSRPEDQIVA